MIKQFNITDITASNEKILEQILSIEFIDFSNSVFIRKTNQKGFSMKWHLDDCCIFKHSKPPEYGNFIQIDKKRYSIYQDG